MLGSGEVTAVLVATCEARSINPFEYLSDMLIRVPDPLFRTYLYAVRVQPETTLRSQSPEIIELKLGEDSTDESIPLC